MSSLPDTEELFCCNSFFCRITKAHYRNNRDANRRLRIPSSSRLTPSNWILSVNHERGSPLRRSLEIFSPVSQQNPLVYMPDFGREARRVRVVRDHDDGFVVIAIEFFEQRQRLLRRSRVQVAGRLVGQNKIGVGDDGAGDGDALVLPAGELARLVVYSVSMTDHV